LSLNENELASENAAELNKMRAEIEQTKVELISKENELDNKKKDQLATARRSTVENPLRTSISEYNQIERERADLLTRVSVAEQRANEQQEYIDTHLARYKNEIVRLRRVISDKGIRVDLPPLSPGFKPGHASFRF